MGILVIPFAVAADGFRAFVAQRLWFWFLLPLGAPEIGFWNVWGVFVCISVVTSAYSIARLKKEEMDKATQTTGAEDFAFGLVKVGLGFFVYACLLFEGWIIHSIMV